MIPSRIRDLRKESGLTQQSMAEKLGLSQQAVAKYEKGTATPNPETLMEIAKVLGVRVGDLFEEEGNLRQIPILGQVAAGIPIDAIEENEGTVPVSDDLGAGDYFALRINGNSMEPRMKKGDIVIVRQQPDVENGQIAVVMVGNEEATCKKISKSREGITLISTNPVYDPMFFSAKEVQTLPVVILGRVVELRAKY